MYRLAIISLLVFSVSMAMIFLTPTVIKTNISSNIKTVLALQRYFIFFHFQLQLYYKKYSKNLVISLLHGEAFLAQEMSVF